MSAPKVALLRLVEDVVRCEVDIRDGAPKMIHFADPSSVFGIEQEDGETIIEFDLSPINGSKQLEHHVGRETPIVTMAYAYRVVFVRYEVPYFDAEQVKSSIPQLETRESVQNMPKDGIAPHHRNKAQDIVVPLPSKGRRQ